MENFLLLRAERAAEELAELLTALEGPHFDEEAEEELDSSRRRSKKQRRKQRWQVHKLPLSLVELLQQEMESQQQHNASGASRFGMECRKAEIMRE